MTFSWKRRTSCPFILKKGSSKVSSEIELTIPTHFRCPISLDLMKDPVTLSTGITYDRESIERWIEAGNQTCPVTNQVLSSFDLTPNHALRKMIQDWCVENRAHGIERIPTPRIPISQYDLSQICVKIGVSTQKGDEKKCKELVGKIKIWAKESERNKMLIMDNGLGYVLASSFESFSSISIEKHVGVLEEILSLLTWMFPLGVEGQAKLGSTSSLRCMAWFLKGEDLSAKRNTVLALRELLSLDQKYVNGLNEIEGVPEALFKILKDPISPTMTKASLTTIYYMVSESATSEKITSRFLELGLLELTLEILVDAEKGLLEKGLGVIDAICSFDQGAEKALKHELMVPVLAKKILRVSALATDFCVSILWKLGKKEDESALVEALLMGAFQKLLVVLQVNCGEGTKEKATELLKSMNQYRSLLDCFASSRDFKYLKKSSS